MEKKKKKVISAPGIILIIACVLAIAGTLTTNLMFKNANATPHLFGYDVFLNRDDSMEPRVSANTAVYVEKTEQYQEGNVVLFLNASGKKQIGRLNLIVENTDEDGSVSTDYYLTNEDGTETMTAPKSSLYGVCKKENAPLGKVMLFLTSTLGMVLFLLLPCIFLLIYLVARIIGTLRHDEEEEDEDEPLYKDVKKMGQARKPKTPLFVPDDALKDEEFVEKKKTISEHFAKKAVDPEAVKPSESDARRVLDEASIRSKKAKLTEADRLVAEERGTTPKLSQKPELTEEEEVEDRAATIKRAMQQRAEERRRIAEAETRTIEASKAKSAAAAPKPAPERPAAPVKKPAAPVRKPAPASRPVPRPAAPAKPKRATTSFEDLMKQLDEEKKKLR